MGLVTVLSIFHQYSALYCLAARRVFGIACDAIGTRHLKILTRLYHPHRKARRSLLSYELIIPFRQSLILCMATSNAIDVDALRALANIARIATNVRVSHSLLTRTYGLNDSLS